MSDPARHPLSLTPARRLATADADQHVADLVRLVLLTGPGERLHRPELGAGLGASALFAPLEGTLAGLVEMRIRGSLDQALGDRLDVVAIDVAATGESELSATVTYRRRPTGPPITVEVDVGG